MKIGSKVACVDDVFPAWVKQAYAALPAKGEVYTVRELSPGRGLPAVVRDGKVVPNGGGDEAPEIYILLEELRNPQDPLCRGRELGFKADRFAPVEFEEDEAEEGVAVGAGVAVPAFCG